MKFTTVGKSLNIVAVETEVVMGNLGSDRGLSHMDTMPESNWD